MPNIAGAGVSVPGRYRMTNQGIQKIGVRAPCVTGRAAYRYPLDQDRQALVVRNFYANPSGQYMLSDRL